MSGQDDRIYTDIEFQTYPEENRFSEDNPMPPEEAEFPESSVFVLFAVSSNAAVPTFIQEFGGWFESAYVMWDKTAGYDYDVYIAPASTDSWV